MKHVLFLSIAGLCTVAQSVFAADDTVPAAAPVEAAVTREVAAPVETVPMVPIWKASAEIGYVSTSGNTQTDTLNAKGMASTDRENWRHKMEVTALKASDEMGTTAEKYTFSAQSDYKLRDPNYLFGLITYENDKFSGYQYQTGESIGYGRRVVNEPSVKLDLEIGPGARQSKLDSGETDNEALLRGAAKLEWDISASAKFTEALTVEAGQNATITKSVTGLSARINGSLSMKITYTYKNTSEVPVGTDDTDTETAVTLVYNF